MPDQDNQNKVGTTFGTVQPPKSDAGSVQKTTPPPPPVSSVPPPPAFQEAGGSVLNEEKKPPEPKKEKEEDKKKKEKKEEPIAPGGEKPKKSGKKTIATILGVLFLVGGIGAGVVLVQQQQDIREEAKVIDGTGGGTGSSVKCGDTGTNNQCGASGGCPAGQKCVNSYVMIYSCKTRSECTVVDTKLPNGLSCTSNNQCKSGYCDKTCKNKPAPAPKSCATGDLCRKQSDGCPSGYKITGGSCSITDSICCTPDGIGGTSCILDNNCLEGREDVCCSLKQYDDPTCTTPIKKRCGVKPGGTTPQKTATPAPGSPSGSRLSCKCTEIKVFGSEGILLTADTLKDLVVGDVITVATRGTASSGAITKARFIINGTTRPEITGKQEIGGVSYYTDTYTIPESVTSFTVNAQLFHPSVGWF